MIWCGPPDCDTWHSFCYVLVSSCLFLSPNPIIVFLQLCDMSAAVLDTCEGDVQGKRSQPRLLSTRPSQPGHSSRLCTLHAAQTCMAASLLLPSPASAGAARSMSSFGFLGSLAFFFFFFGLFFLSLGDGGESQAGFELICSQLT